MLHLPNQPFADGCFVVVKRQLFKEITNLRDGHEKELRQGLFADKHILGVLAQTRAFTNVAFGSAAVTADHDPVLNLVALGFEGRKESVDALESRTSMPHHVLLVFCQIMPRRMHRQIDAGGRHDHAVSPTASSFSPPRGDRSVVKGSGGVGNDLAGVDAQHMAIPFARAACTHWTVEVEHVRTGLWEEDAVPFEAVVECRACCAAVLFNVPHLTLATALKQSCVRAVRHSPWIFRCRGGGETVHHDAKDLVGLDVLEPHGPLVGPRPRVPLLEQHPALVFGGPVLSGGQGGDDEEARGGGLQNVLDNVGDAVFAHHLARHRRARLADARIEHAQVVQNFGPCAHGAPRSS